MNKINKQNRNRLTDTENNWQLSVGNRVGGLGEKSEGAKQKNKK